MESTVECDEENESDGAQCSVCNGTGLLLADPCPLCVDELSTSLGDSGAAESTCQYYCDICQKDLQSAASLAGHVDGRKHRHRLAMSGQLAPSKRVPSAAPALTTELLFAQLAQGEFRHIVVCTGAGVSTAAGIPDFRSPGGLFEAIREKFGARFSDVATTPENLMSRSFARTHPQVWEDEVLPWLQSWKCKEALPTATHWFCSWLHRRGWLRRIYTQNVDGLHSRPELALPSSMVVECHGALRDGSVVLYGDPLPTRFEECCRQDFPRSCRREEQADLVLVLGTSLQVAPFCAVPNAVPKGCTRVMVNRKLAECMVNDWSHDNLDWMNGGLDFAYRLPAPTVRIGCNKNVELRPLWRTRKARSRWPQLLVESDCDSFVSNFFMSAEAKAFGFTLRPD